MSERALTSFLPDDPLRSGIAALTRRPEPELVPALLEQARFDDATAAAVEALARRIAQGVRQRALEGSGLVQNLLQQYALSSQEGIALMCLAEALLRIPDSDTRDALIREKIGAGDWRAHLGGSPSLFVNAATWGLMLTGKLVATHSDAGLSAALRRIVSRGGEPLVRAAVDRAMRLMGEQFVTGQTIGQALANAEPREAAGFRFSYDMLGEAALTAADADAYFEAYARAIDAIGAAARRRGIYEGPGISIKLSALHPRYTRAQIERVRNELYPRLRSLAERARSHDIGLNIDAEESERLELSLELLERLCREPSLAGWNGVGFVAQAYQKRCPAVVDFIVDLARTTRRRIMVRLVKGAYWDSEIKRAQLEGQDDYPVYTRKPYTDLAYLACARRLLAAPDAVFPQFATHNAQTLASIVQMAGPNFYAGQYEFQCLHGMGEPLYEQIVAPPAGLDDAQLAARPLPQGRPCRIYAPVGNHETLLAYLVRRLLENGANSSFVNRIADQSVPIDELVRDPVREVEAMAARDGRVGAPHPSIPLPKALYAPGRENSKGLDLNHEPTLRRLDAALNRRPAQAAVPSATAPSAGVPSAAPPSATTTAATAAAAPDRARRILNPADQVDEVGRVEDADPNTVQAALAHADAAAEGWANTEPGARADRLEAAADRLQAFGGELLELLVREAGKTLANAQSELREAVDFLRYYAMIVRAEFDVREHRPLGVCVCISPWNFPLAIFLGQVSAALAAGNTVIAKPAEQTPLVALAAVRVMHDAGIPSAVLQVLPGPGETVGAALVADARVQAVLFTGSTEVARLIQRALAQRLGRDGRPVPLVAETGGQNAMIVDSSALPEQVTADVLTSAFDSAGQRCSALRLLCVQDEVADRLLPMIEGALREWRIGDPRELATDIGPMIDAAARRAVVEHLDRLRARGRRVTQPTPLDPALARRGHFQSPALVDIESIGDLQHEVFGPVLHVVRFARGGLPDLLEQINATGYGLTLGVHTRIDETVAQVVRGARAGNLYVNRNMVGAVVGVQAFGGEGLSGTGPKAGGPLYLYRLLSRRPGDSPRRAVLRFTDNLASATRRPPLPTHAGALGPESVGPTLEVIAEWAGAPEQTPGGVALAVRARALADTTPVCAWRSMRGATGEANLYCVLARERILGIADHDGDRLAQLAAVLAVGSTMLWPAAAQRLRERLPPALREHVVLVSDWTDPAVPIDAVLVSGSEQTVRETCLQMAQRPGPIVPVEAVSPGDAPIALERLVIERSVSINTAAAGGNASLMALGA